MTTRTSNHEGRCRDIHEAHEDGNHEGRVATFTKRTKTGNHEGRVVTCTKRTKTARRWFDLPWWQFALAFSISALLAGGIRWLSGMPSWVCWLIVLGAMAVNGYLATWEDERPGGFNHPDPSN